MSKVGIFGGSFDPVHIGHTELAVQAAKELKLSETIVIPAFHSPLKPKCSATFAQRFEMVRLAFEGIPGFAVSDIEKKLGGKSFTINTIRALKEIYPKKTEFYLIIGGDQLFTIEKWFRYEAILKEVHVAAVTREGISYTDMVEYANEIGRIKVLDLPVPDISSTQIRSELSHGGSAEGLLCPAVLGYIRKEGIYIA